MIKPSDFEAVQGLTEFEELQLGGHVCRIMKVEEKKTATGKDQIAISMDIAEGKQANYYANKFQNDTRENKKWGCTVFQLVLDNEGGTNPFFKTFIESVEKSNPGFQVQWGANFGEQFTGKLVGGVFGREEYINGNNESKFAIKCVNFRTVEQVKAGVPVPKDKMLKGPRSAATPFTPNIPTMGDSSLPF